METLAVTHLKISVFGLNEGWPECGMETIFGRPSATNIVSLNEGWPECGMETYLLL